MNAYDLADEAEKAYMTNTSQYFSMPLINLVRQQADQLADQQTTINFLECECAALREQLK